MARSGLHHLSVAMHRRNIIHDVDRLCHAYCKREGDNACERGSLQMDGSA